ncbi:hypothetical protein Hanom_Chr02g00134821 [Helianthus anomalus]
MMALDKWVGVLITLPATPFSFNYKWPNGWGGSGCLTIGRLPHPVFVFMVASSDGGQSRRGGSVGPLASS